MSTQWYELGAARWRHAESGLLGCYTHGRRGTTHAEPRNAPAGDVPVIPGKDNQ